jgi:hypothetical protein
MLLITSTTSLSRHPRTISRTAIQSASPSFLGDNSAAAVTADNGNNYNSVDQLKFWMVIGGAAFAALLMAIIAIGLWRRRREQLRDRSAVGNIATFF